MDSKIILLFTNTLFNFVLGMLVWLSGARNELRRVFIVFSAAIGMWSFGLAMFFLITDQSIALFWAKTLYIAGSTIALSLCYFSFIFPTFYLNRRYLPWVKIFLFGFSGLTYLLTLFTNLVLSGVVEGNYKGLTYSWGYAIWLLHFLSLMTVAFINQFIQLRRSGGMEKLQIKYMLIGTFTAAIFGSATNVIMPTFGNFMFFGIGPLLTISMAGFIAYAIVRHRLMDIRLVVARTVAYSVMVAIIGIFYVIASTLTSSLLLNSALGNNPLVLYSLLTLVVAFSFDKLRKNIESVTDRFFFKGRYDSSQLLSKLGNIMSSTLELNSLSSQILETLSADMRISRAALVLLEKESVYGISAVNFSHPPSYDYPKLIQILVSHQPIIFDELPEGELKQLMRVLNVSVSATLRVKEDLVGVFLLGEKASGETYSGEDLKVLGILMPEVAIAIANAKAVDKIKKFNITLVQEVQKATAELRLANEKLKVLDKLKDDFVSIASHELRTPMTAIKSYLWMAINRPDMKLSEKMTKYISRAYLSTERLINLVNDMLNVSRIEAGRIEVRPQVFDILQLCDEVASEISAKAGEKMIKLAINKTQVPQVFADPDKIHQVLLNLVGNALKFVATNGEIAVSFFTDGQVLETSVRDNGVGIAKEDVGKLFQKFGRLDNSYVAAATTGGTGLGLYITKNLVELMGGKIWVTSEGLGKGSTFTFSLPIATKEVLANAAKFTKNVTGEAKGLEPVAI